MHRFVRTSNRNFLRRKMKAIGMRRRITSPAKTFDPKAFPRFPPRDLTVYFDRLRCSKKGIAEFEIGRKALLYSDRFRFATRGETSPRGWSPARVDVVLASSIARFRSISLNDCAVNRNRWEFHDRRQETVVFPIEKKECLASSVVPFRPMSHPDEDRFRSLDKNFNLLVSRSRVSPKNSPSLPFIFPPECHSKWGEKRRNAASRRFEGYLSRIRPKMGGNSLRPKMPKIRSYRRRTDWVSPFFYTGR